VRNRHENHQASGTMWEGGEVDNIRYHGIVSSPTGFEKGFDSGCRSWRFRLSRFAVPFRGWSW
jgi:hypothetical protein